MSGEIVVGACYRDPTDGEIVRAIAVEPDGWWHCVTVRPGRSSGCVGNDIVCALSTWERVPDPMPAVIGDEDTLAELEAWIVERGGNGIRTGVGASTGGQWFASADSGAHGRGATLLDALRAMMRGAS